MSFMLMFKMLERFSYFFSFLLTIVSIFLLWRLQWGGVPLVLVTIYLVPPLLWRVISSLYPLQMGFSNIGVRQNPSAWMISYHLQLLFGIIPWLEKILMMIPGLYSAWLRLWGARIGKNIFWTPGIEIVDRPLLSVGDWVVIGHKTYISSHVITREDQKTQLFLRPVSIEGHAFIGAFSVLNAGTRVAASESIKAGTICLGLNRIERF